MEYTNYEKHHGEPVDAFVLQAPVSDREMMDLFFSDVQDIIAFCKGWMEVGKGQDCLPSSLVPKSIAGGPVTAYRMHSLCAKG